MLSVTGTMAAELSKQKFLLRAATLLFLLLLSVVAYGAITDTIVGNALEVVTSTDVVYDVPSGNFIYHDVGINHSKPLAAIEQEQELEVVVKVSYMDFCTVMWKNKHLLRHVPERRVIENMCPLTRQSGNATDTVMEETPVSDITSNIAPGGSEEETGMELQDSLDQISNQDKLTEWCKHRDQIDNIIVRHLLRGICRNIIKPGTIIPVESSGTVTETHVGLDSDVTTEAVADVTPETTHDYSLQAIVTSVPSSVTGEGRSIDASDVSVVVCANLHLINAPSLVRRVLNNWCRLLRLSDTGRNTTSDAEGASDVAQYLGLSSQISRLDKVREVCTHLDEAKNVSHLSTFLPSICSNIDEPR